MLRESHILHLILLGKGSFVDTHSTRWKEEAMENPFATTDAPFNQTDSLADRFMFGWLDYTLFSMLLLVSILIGVYFAFFSKQDSRTEYLLGGKRMGCFPVAMSIMARSVIPQ